MSFVNNAGHDVATNNIDEHECKWMRLESPALWDLVAAGQQGDHLHVLGGVKVVDYYTALQWAMEVANMKEWAGELFWKQRPEPAAVSRCLKTAVGRRGKCPKGEVDSIGEMDT